MFGKIFKYLFILIAIADIYIFAVFIQKLTKSIWLRLLWFVPTLALFAGLYYFFFVNKGSEYRDLFIFIFIGLTIPKVFFTIISLLDLPLRYFFKWKVYPFTIVGLLACVGIEYIVVYGSVFGKTQFEVKNVEFASTDLPDSFDGYKIVQISDLHIGNWKDKKDPIRKVVRMINEQEADAVMVTGDLVNYIANELNGYDEILSEIKAKDGVYSILGNHDYGIYYYWDDEAAKDKNMRDLKKKQIDMGWNLLINDHTYLRRNNDSIALIGVENSGSTHFPDYADLPKAMEGSESTPFKVLLSHDPTHWRREALGADINLMLAGHTHASQFSLWNFSIAQFFYPEWRGLYIQKEQALYVNVGIGYVGLPFRFGAWPEITVITLKKE